MAWETDTLKNRANVADSFEKLARNFSSECVFLVSAEFGMGKTFFVENWASSLNDRNIPVLHFDAWKNDYLESPLAGFVSSLHEQLPKGDEYTPARNKIKDFAKTAAPIILKSGVKIGARILTMGAIEGDIDKIKEILVDEGLSRIDDVADETIKSFQTALSQKTFHAEMQERFHGAVSEIRSKKENEPMFVLIDELDRCRPEFSLSLLEDIKHFLGVEGVKFFIFLRRRSP